MPDRRSVISPCCGEIVLVLRAIPPMVCNDENRCRRPRSRGGWSFLRHLWAADRSRFTAAAARFIITL